MALISDKEPTEGMGGGDQGMDKPPQHMPDIPSVDKIPTDQPPPQLPASIPGQPGLVVNPPASGGKM